MSKFREFKSNDLDGKEWTTQCLPGYEAIAEQTIQTNNFSTSLKEDARSRVYVFEQDGKTYVVKYPDAGDKKLSSKIRSFFSGNSYAQRQAESLEKLRSWGHRTPAVFAYGTLIQNGFVTQSFLIMEHLKSLKEGFEPNLRQCELIAQTVFDIHSRGFLHGDPYVQNFMFDRKTESVVSIDVLLKKSPLWLTAKITEWFHLDWGARLTNNNAIRIQKEKIIKKHPARYLLYRVLTFLKTLKKKIF